MISLKSCLSSEVENAELSGAISLESPTVL